MSATGPRSTRSSSTTTCTMAMSSAASVPGRMGTHSSAWSAVPVRRGSITITVPPRSRMASISPSTSGQAKSEPPDAWGFPPMMIRWSVRGRSTVGIFHELPYISVDVTFFGHWSIVPAE